MFPQCRRGQSRPLALQMTVRHTGISFSSKSASKPMQPTYNAVNRGTNVSGHRFLIRSDCGQIIS